MNGRLLVIDASTYRGTVAIVDGPRVLAEREVQMRGVDEERLMPAVSDTLSLAGIPVAGLSGVVCGAGPGSFTSLRIAASIAKGIAAAGGVPLLSVSSLALIVVGGSEMAEAGRYMAATDAMRGDVFALRLDVGPDGRVEAEGHMTLAPAASAFRIAHEEGRLLVGPAQGEAWFPHVRGVARLHGSHLAPSPVDLATWEPSYGRLAEAQVTWERTHGRSLGV